MFSNRSTDNLLDNLESELNEVIELDNPVRVDVSSEVQVINESKKVKNQPEPSRRVFVESKKKTSSPQPVAAVRRVTSRDKNEKNDENEIIQLSSVSSNSQSDHKNILRKNNDKVQTETIFMVDEKDKSAGKLSQSSKVPRKEREVEVKVEIVSEKVMKTSTSVTSSYNSSSESSTSPSSSEKVKIRKKKSIERRRRSDKKDEISQVSKEKNDEKSTHDIGVFIHSCGPVEFRTNLRSGLRVKVSLYNEDTGKMIGDVKVTGTGKFNNDFQ